MRKSKNRYFHVPQPTFLSPGNAPAIITQYVAWMEREVSACRTPRSIYLSIFNSFPVIRTASAKKSTFSQYVEGIDRPKYYTVGQSRSLRTEPLDRSYTTYY